MDIQHISSKENIFADSLSGIEFCKITLEYKAEAYNNVTQRWKDANRPSLKIKKSSIQDRANNLTVKFLHVIIHNQAHPEGRANAKQVSQSFRLVPYKKRLRIMG